MFLRRYLSSVSQGGILISIIPFSTLRNRSCLELLAQCGEYDVYRFPDGEYERFNQIVVVSRKAKLLSLDFYNESYRTLQHYDDIKDLPSIEEMKAINLSFSERRHRLTYRANHIAPDDLMPLTASLKQSFIADMEPPDLRAADIRPLVPLKQGHLAMLLAAGYINGELEAENGDRFVIKGSVKKDSATMEESNETHEITKTVEKSVINVRVLNLNTGEIETIS